MNKKITICLIIVLIFSIFGSCFFIFYNNYQSDKKKTKNEIEKIKEEYKNFKEEVNIYSTLRSDLYNNVFDVYLNEIEVNYENFINKMTSYEDQVLLIDNISLNLNKDCNINYYDQEVLNKCEAFRLSYEQINNYFVKDVNRFNENISSYNNWSDKKLKSYEMKKQRGYIDYNNDKIEFGKE